MRRPMGRLERLTEAWLDVRISEADLDSEACLNARRLSEVSELAPKQARQLVARAHRRAVQRENDKLAAVASFRIVWSAALRADQAAFAAGLGMPVAEVTPYLDRLEREFQTAAADHDALSGLLAVTAVVIPRSDRTPMWLKLEQLSADNLPKKPEPWILRQAMLIWFLILLFWIWLRRPADGSSGLQHRGSDQAAAASDAPRPVWS